MVFFVPTGRDQSAGLIVRRTTYVSAQPLDFLDLDNKSSFLNWKRSGCDSDDGRVLLSVHPEHVCWPVSEGQCVDSGQRTKHGFTQCFLPLRGLERSKDRIFLHCCAGEGRRMCVATGFVIPAPPFDGVDKCTIQPLPSFWRRPESRLVTHF